MTEAGAFFPFPLTCDVETTFKWYGLGVEDVLSFDKPESLDVDKLTESNIKWLQSMIVENEYILPKFNGPDGKKPQGIAAEGVNGKWTEELANAISDYKTRFSINDDSVFLDHIESKVLTGRILPSNR